MLCDDVNLRLTTQHEKHKKNKKTQAIHPSGHTGHRVMAELVIELFEQTIAGLRARPGRRRGG